MNSSSKEWKQDVCILIPTMNERYTIGSVVSDFKEHGYDNILVIDGGSNDGTKEIAESEGATIIEQTTSGKGAAIREAIHEHISSPYVIMVDGDTTYLAKDADKLIEPVINGTYEHVIGNRFYDLGEDSMHWFNKVGNSIINKLFYVINGTNLQDILSGYRAFTLESANELHLRKNGFGIETEMSSEVLRNNQSVGVRGVSYRSRPKESTTKLKPLRDGIRIYRTLYTLTRRSNPIFYFGLVAFLLGFFGIILGLFVVYDFFVNGNPHHILAIGSGVTLVLSIQLVIFGVLADMIVSLHEEQLRVIRELKDD